MSNQDRKQFPKSGNKPQPAPSAGKAKEQRKDGEANQRKTDAAEAKKVLLTGYDNP